MASAKQFLLQEEIGNEEKGGAKSTEQIEHQLRPSMIAHGEVPFVELDAWYHGTKASRRVRDLLLGLYGCSARRSEAHQKIAQPRITKATI
jgi:hypothetical protein